MNELMSEYESLYNNTISHSERLNNRIGNSIAIITVLGTGNILVWKEYFTKPINTIYLILCFIALLSFIVTMILFYRAYSGYTYAYFPIEDIASKISETIELTKNDTDNGERCNNHIRGMMGRTYLRCAVENTKQNIIKNNRYKKFITSVVFSFIAIAIAYGFSIGIINNSHI